jgi:hypothetical protein
MSLFFLVHFKVSAVYETGGKFATDINNTSGTVPVAKFGCGGPGLANISAKFRKI